MKKVRILEKFETHEEMVKYLADYEGEMFENVKATNPLKVGEFELFIERYKEQIEVNPNGRWIGFDGKSNYRQFCDVARASIRRNPNAKFRVVEGEIPDDAKYWVGYKFVKENEGVLRYLMATK